MGRDGDSNPYYEAINAAAAPSLSRPALAEAGFQGVDAAHAQCRFRDDGWCAIAWQRMIVRDSPDWKPGNPLAQALAAAAGYFTAVESSDQWFCEGHLYPGEGDGKLKTFL